MEAEKFSINYKAELIKTNYFKCLLYTIKIIAFGVNLLHLVECFYGHNNIIFRGFAMSYWEDKMLAK